MQGAGYGLIYCTTEIRDMYFNSYSSYYDSVKVISNQIQLRGIYSKLLDKFKKGSYLSKRP